MAYQAVRRWLKRLGVGLTVLTLLLLALAYGLTSTEVGFRYLLTLTKAIPGVSLSFTEVSGTPAQGLLVQELIIDQERVQIRIDQLNARISPMALLTGGIHLIQSQAQSVLVIVKPGPHPHDPRPPQFMPLGWRVVVDRLMIKQLSVQSGQSHWMDAKDLQAKLRVTAYELGFSQTQWDAGTYQLATAGTLKAASPMTVRANVNLRLRVSDQPVALAGQIGGDLNQLKLEAHLQQLQQVGFAGVLDLRAEPVLWGGFNIKVRDLSPWLTSSALGAIQSQLSLHTNFHDFTLSGPLRAAALSEKPGALEVAGRYDYPQLMLRRVAWQAGGSGPSFDLVGDLHLAPKVDADLTLRWARLRWPLSGAQTLSSEQGQIRLKGAEPWAIDLQSQLSGPSPWAAQLAGQAMLYRDRIDVTQFSARSAQGQLALKGVAAFDDKALWQGQVSLQNFDPGPFNHALRGRLALSLQAQGQGYTPLRSLQAQVTQLTGSVQGKPVSGGGTVSLQAGVWQVSNAHLTLASLSAAGQGRWGAGVMEWSGQGELSKASDFLSDAAGSLKLQGHYRASASTQQFMARATGRDWRLADNRLHAVDLQADLDSQGPGESHLNLLAQGAQIGAQKIDRLVLQGDGLAELHHWQLAVQSAQQHLTAAAHGSYNPRLRTEQLQVSELSVAATPGAPYTLVAPAVWVISPHQVVMASTCLQATPAQTCLDLNWEAGAAWSLHSQWSQLPLSLFAGHLPATMQVQGSLSGRLSAQGVGADVHVADLQANSEAVQISYALSAGRTSQIEVRSADLGAHLEANEARVNAHLTTTQDSTLQLSAVADRTPGHALGEALLHGDVQARSHEVDFLPLFIPQLDRVAGQLTADLTLGGQIQAPLLGGSLSLEHGEADVYLSNLKLRQIHGEVALHDSALDLKAHAQIGTGQLDTDGSLQWSQGQPSGSLHVTGNQLLLADLPELRVVASPDVKLDLKGTRLKITGDVKVPSARIAPRDLSKAVSVSPDQVLVGRQAGAATTPWDIDTQIKLSLGPDVKLQAYGVSGLVQGTLAMSAKNNALVTGAGELEIKDGHYLAYARELDIEHGRLLFGGGSVDDAGLDIRASKKLPGYKAGVNVHGTLQAPQLSFFSDPSLPQSQIASLLIVGSTTDAQGGAGSLLAAQGSAMLVGDYARQVGIDQMTVESDATNGTALVLGKFLSPRLYVSYGISLAQAINTLKLRYTIGDSWVLNTESGLMHSADIQYSFQR